MASTTLHAGPQTFGIISACFGAGALIGALVSASIGRASWKILAVGTGLFGLAELLLAPERSVWAAGVLLVAARRLLHDVDVERELRRPARGARPPARPRRRPLLLRLQRRRPARRTARRLAQRDGRNGARARGRRHRGARDDRRSACSRSATSPPGPSRSPSWPSPPRSPPDVLPRACTALIAVRRSASSMVELRSSLHGGVHMKGRLLILALLAALVVGVSAAAAAVIAGTDGPDRLVRHPVRRPRSTAGPAMT